MSRPSVSVIIPAFNAERFLPEALDSALAQTVAPLEIVVVDDGSTDGTRALADRYGAPVRVLSQPNRGLPFARNAGARTARGDWLAFLDADDIWLPRKLEQQLALASDEVAVIYTDRENFGALEGLPPIQSAVTPLREGDLFMPLLLEGNMLAASSTMIRRAVFDELGGFVEDPAILSCEDWDLWLRVSEHHRTAVCREPLMRYRLHASSLSRDSAQMNRTRLLVIERALSLDRGRALPWLVRRRVLAATHRTNGWDASRSGHWRQGLASYVRSILYSPFHWPAYAGLARLVAGRH